MRGRDSCSYDYPADPINKLDLTGNCICLIAAIFVVLALAIWVPTGSNASKPYRGRATPAVDIPTTPTTHTGKRDTKNQWNTVPRASGSKEPKDYVVYRVYPADNSDTWKFGKTSVFSGSSPTTGYSSQRPVVSMAACDEYYGQTCVWSVVAPARSYFQARSIEEQLIRAYQILNDGYCPPGQVTSCK